jgi:serine/threonine protein kinase
MSEAVDNFLYCVLRSGLLRKQEIEEALRAVPEEEKSSPERLAQALVQIGKLSRFQARKLLQGVILGLCLGPYQVHTPIGKGGMGNVFLAIDARTGQHVAIKVLPPKKAREEERLLARFQREMAISQRVSHPHLAKTLDAGVWQGVYYIVMEYIPGQSLHRTVASKGPLTVPRAARLFCEVASALEHAHSLGMVHRDLKPSNIMVTPRDHAKVLDLGLAMMEGEAGELDVVGGKGYVVGSADYIAPEQTIDSTNVDARTDVYALGCTLYFAFTGGPPFTGASSRDKIVAHRSQEPTPLQWRNPNVPDELAVVVHKMMAKKPGERLPSMAAVREALKAWRKSEEVQPMDQEGDPSYLSALAELGKAAVPESLADIPIIRADLANRTNKAESEAAPNPALPPPHPDMMALAEIERRLKDMRKVGYLVAAFCGVMVLLLGVLLFLVLRL